MGMVFGRVSVEEPVFESLFLRAATVNATVAPTAAIPYEIRRYGKRYAIEAEFDSSNENRSPFMALAGYIGVTKAPENEANEAIAMTAPVAIERNHKSENNGDNTPNNSHIVQKVAESKQMRFILPSKYDDMSKIPKPTNSNKVSLKEIPPSVGAVHTFNGSFDDAHCLSMTNALATQLLKDGVDLPKADGDELVVPLEKIKYEWWGYNPPFTIPMLRRNEVWIELTEKQVEELIALHNPTQS